MLLTVQDIPDVTRKNSSSTISNLNQNQNQHYRITESQTLRLPPSTNNNHYTYSGSVPTVKRSQSCTSQEENASVISRLSINTTGHIRERCGDYYDTASTTTTLTPTPSESGRDTPHQLHLHQNYQQQYTNSTNGTAYNYTQQRTIEQRERQLIMDLQSQSHEYAQASRSAAPLNDSNHLDGVSSTAAVYSATSENGEDIPYHAREDSRPFTYGDPTGVQLSPTGGMIKSQSGLSSPSLVRKHLGRNTSSTNDVVDKTSGTHKNANGRTDFEEMLMKRREKILNDKYSIGDSNGNIVNNSVNTSANKWNTSSPSINVKIERNDNNSNGYHQHREPLKRSNTLDGFGRENISNGYVSDR